jgi:urate oxidase
MATLASNQYGKSKVRFLRVSRQPDGTHHVIEIEADVLLCGDLDGSFLTDDNSSIVPTDTVKNTIHLLAHDHPDTCRNRFALVIGNHFLTHYDWIHGVTIELRERPWSRMGNHPHTFSHDANGTPFTHATFERGGEPTLTSGIRNHLVMKTTASAFVGYHVCERTTLPPTEDRILATRLAAEWTLTDISQDFAATDRMVREQLLRIFADTFSPSVQRTLFLMGEAALAAAPGISSIRLALPNVHFLPLDLSKIGRPAQTTIFLPTDEPHGQIEATVTR